MAVAFGILRLLPAVGEHQETLQEAAGEGFTGSLKSHAYIVVLLSFIIGRWILAAAVLLGWGVNYLAEIPAVGPALIQAFIAGGVLLNVLKEQLPEARESRYWDFVLGALAYGALLVAF